MARRTGLAARAVALTTLSAENLAFFKERGLVSAEGLGRAETALGNLHKFLQRNRNSFTQSVARDLSFLKSESTRTQKELKSLWNDFRQAEDPRTRALIEGQINLTQLRLRRLQSLFDETGRIQDFLAGSGPSPDSNAST